MSKKSSKDHVANYLGKPRNKGDIELRQTPMRPIVDLIVCPMSNPSDVSFIEKAFQERDIDPFNVVAVIGKSEGSGLPNDYGRLLADLKVRELLARLRNTTPEAIADEVTIAISGGAPGTIAPHATLLIQKWEEVDVSDEVVSTGGIVLGRSSTRDILPEHIGRVEQVDAISEAVKLALDEAGVIDVNDVHMVLVKGPALTYDAITRAESSGVDVVTKDPGIGPMGSMCYSNDAMAIGVGVALGEIDRAMVSNASVRSDWNLYSNLALTSSGGEKRKGEVLVVANRKDSGSRFKAGHGITSEFGENDGVKQALKNAGLDFDCCPSNEQKSQIAQVFAKFTLPPSSTTKAGRVTVLEDHEAHHVAKAVGGAIVTSVTGLKMVFISGGEANSHMGPPGGNPVCAIVKI